MATRAINELLQHSKALRRLARDLVGASDADDVLQDAAVELVRTQSQPISDVLPWLRAVIRNLASKRRRALATRKRHEAITGRSDKALLDAGAETADTMRWLIEQVASLPEPYRSTLLARYVNDRLPAQIAVDSGTALATVKTRLKRGVAMLRERCEARGKGWRPALVATFGIEAHPCTAVATTTVGTARALILMSATTKTVLAMLAIAFLLLAWQPWQPAKNDGVERSTAPAAAGVVQLASPPAPIAAGEAEATSQPQRSLAPPVTVQPTKATAEQVVIQVLDARTSAPITGYGLRQHRSAKLNVLAKQAPLHHAGEHPNGRLVVSRSMFEEANFVVETTADAYLPSTWFDVNDITEEGGERIVQVRLGRPVEVVLRVVLKRTHTPIAGARVELLRPWPGHGDVTVRTRAVPSDQMRAKANNESPLIIAFSGGRALLLQTGQTDAQGQLQLRVPPGEPLALRLLGPGHTPIVKHPWSVEPGEQPVERTETVTSGGAILVRLLPAEALQRLQLERPANTDHVHPQMWARYATGVRLRNTHTNQLRPPGGAMLGPPLPLDEHGRVRIDGLTAGDWEVRVCYSLRHFDEPASHPLSGLGMIQVVLPEVQSLAEQELRILDVDLTGWMPGKLEASLARDDLTQDNIIRVRPVAATTAAMTHINSANLRPNERGTFSARLPPARYFATRVLLGKGSLPLGEFTIRALETTQVHFTSDHVAVRVRVVDHDGTAPAPGVLQLRRAGWIGGASLDEAGLATIEHVLRGDSLTAHYLQQTGTHPNGQPIFGPAIPIGIVKATGRDAAPFRLQLPPR